ncbi:Rieske (2Fe-2S) protein [Novacetimonas hansenii]|nr:Rieske (2Fe-2S) protein [Novacetimonas hansenii]QOF96818.1 Rieske (2Fe-2S) protein [Novacetimonas hansenii]RFP03764.1 (2Fe-2S)-binding protein [Novacetimonas hansenii]
MQMAGIPDGRGNAVRLCEVAAVRERPQRVLTQGRALVVWSTQDGRVCVFDDRCPHGNARLSTGYVQYDRLVCPLHMWTFGIRGDVDAPGGRIEAANPMPRPYDAWVEGEDVWADVRPAMGKSAN